MCWRTPDLCDATSIKAHKFVHHQLSPEAACTPITTLQTHVVDKKLLPQGRGESSGRSRSPIYQTDLRYTKLECPNLDWPRAKSLYRERFR